MRVLAVTKIFPNAVEPLSAPFNRQQFAALARYCEVEVLATVPWFPGLDRARAAIPAREVIDGLPVQHPRTLYLPRVGHSLSPALYLASIARTAMTYRGRCDVVLGSWAYPDGCAAVLLARLLGAAAVVKLHGSDINVVAGMRGPRAIMTRLLPEADAVVAVSRALGERALELGVAEERLAVVSNGVDGTRFQVRDRAAARAALDLGIGPLILYVGNLKESKGIGELAAAFEQVAAAAPAVRLAIVGDGPERGRCEALSAALPSRVILAGARPLEEIPTWMAACDVLTLPSWAEGMPNAVLEALACGRRVVATRVGGVPEVIDAPELGELIEPRDVDGLAAALERAATAAYDPAEVARRGARGDWDQSAARLFEVLVGAAHGRVERRIARSAGRRR